MFRPNLITTIRQSVLCACATSFLSLTVLALTPPLLQAVPGDEFWDSNWNLPGPSEDVWAIADFNGQLVVAGDFNFVGNVAANKVAIYNGSTWSPLGIGFDNTVSALCVYNNELYAGGFFNLSDGTPMGGLARWTGTQWVTVDGGTDGSIEDMIVFGGELVITGYFSQVGASTTANSIAGWNGTSWNIFNDGMTGGGGAYALEVYNSELYVAGEFEEVGYNFYSGIARWNGSFWNGVGGGLLDEYGDPYGFGEDLHVHGGKLIVTGYFAQTGGGAYENFATWDGLAWGTLGPDPAFFSGGAFAIGDYAGDLLVDDGNFLTYRWNGFSWSSPYWGAGPFVIGNWAGNLIFGGGFSSVNNVPAANLALFNGFLWSPLASGDGGRRDMRSLGTWGSSIAAGGILPFGGTAGSIVNSWDGSNWTAPGTGIGLGILHAVESIVGYQSGFVAGGNFNSAGGVSVSKIARFDGTSWHAMSTGSTSSVHALTVFNNDLYAPIYNGPQNICRWDGASWIPVGGTVNSTVWALGEYNSQLVVGGSFTTIDGSSITGLATWNGSNWVEIGGSALNGSVLGMTVKDGDLYIGGNFSMVGGNAITRIAKWDGVSWSGLGTGVNNNVWDIEAFNGEIFATGLFTQAGGSPANYIARWDGAAWHAMGSGLEDYGRDLDVYGGKLFVAGNFDTAGGKGAKGIASWSSMTTSVGLPHLENDFLLQPSFPNPFRSQTTLSFELEEPRDVEISIHDAQGRRVQRAFMRGLSAGFNTYTWDGLNTRGKRVAAGTYFVTVRAQNDLARGKVTVMR